MPLAEEIIEKNKQIRLMREKMDKIALNNNKTSTKPTLKKDDDKKQYKCPCGYSFNASGNTSKALKCPWCNKILKK